MKRMTIKVTRSALQKAASIAGLLLTTEALVTEIPEKEKLLRCLQAAWAAWITKPNDRMNSNSRTRKVRLFCIGLLRHMKFFIYHVSEDKPDFVEPLAHALRKDFEVWYDKFELKLGDSLLKKITEGLLSSDFGIVFLSKAFLAKKKWAQNELAGLFALETTTRKIILPIWKDVSEADVKKYSPILADRFAVSASQGIDKVVSEIKIAVNVVQRKDEISKDAASIKVKALVDALEEGKEAERLAYSEKGSQLVSASVITLFNEIERIINEGGTSSSVIKFGFRRPMQHILYVNTGYGMYLGVSLHNLYVNSVADARLDTKVFKRHFGAFGGPDGSGQDLEDRCFTPTFGGGEVIWIEDNEDKRVFLTSELAEYLVHRFVDNIAEQAEVRNR
jgi:hypothetical protein